jgi:hypothetical protein
MVMPTTGKIQSSIPVISEKYLFVQGTMGDEYQKPGKRGLDN